MRYAWRCWYCGHLAWTPGTECCCEQEKRNRERTAPPGQRFSTDAGDQRNTLVYTEHTNDELERYNAQTFVPISRCFKHYKSPPEAKFGIDDPFDPSDDFEDFRDEDGDDDDFDE